MQKVLVVVALVSRYKSMKKIILSFSLFVFVIISNSSVFAREKLEYAIRPTSDKIELSYQDLPQGAYSGSATEMEGGDYESKGERRTVVIICVIAGVLAIGGVIVPLVVF